MDQLSDDFKSLISFYLRQFKEKKNLILYKDSSITEVYASLLAKAHPETKRINLAHQDLRMIRLDKNSYHSILCLESLASLSEDECQRVFWIFGDSLVSQGECWIPDQPKIEILARKNNLILSELIQNTQKPESQKFLRLIINK